MGAASPNAPLDVQIRNTTANVAIALIKIHNIQVEVQELRAEFRLMTEQIKRLLHDPQSRNFDEAARLDAVNSVPNSTNRKR
jgi:hypothetical protein